MVQTRLNTKPNEADFSIREIVATDEVELRSGNTYPVVSHEVLNTSSRYKHLLTLKLPDDTKASFLYTSSGSWVGGGIKSRLDILGIYKVRNCY